MDDKKKIKIRFNHNLGRKEDGRNEKPDILATKNSENDSEQKVMTGYGLALDIGTTTLAAELINLETGRSVSSCSHVNPQRKYGSDVISRIVFCERQIGNLKIIRDILIETVNIMIAELTYENGITPDEITDVVVCGNTVMSHIFAGYDPSSLAKSPFLSKYTGSLVLSPKETGIDLRDDVKITLLPNIAGHVGGDTTACVLATDLTEADRPTLLVDLGTNGEIVLSDGKKLAACSAAAGPAFEGASVKCGMRAGKGAVRAVTVNDDGGMNLETVGDGVPAGICGSGLVDFLAVLLEQGVIDDYGKILTVSPRVREGEEFRELVIASAEELKLLAESLCDYSEEFSDLVLTQNDIRQVQLAKGAIRAGITALLETMDYAESDIEKIILTGAFGSTVRPESALRIGLLPDICETLERGSEDATVNRQCRIETIEDAALEGAKKILRNPAELSAANILQYKIEHVELAKSEAFQKNFIEAMNFDVANN